ncbi:hypothetical protein QB910_000040 [Dabrowskivirus KKP3916]|uniref:BppU N-terminal domain-containing protein n=1 Tax=Alicyclobacillus phage KKP_3916 TaxID=3040651 RepID=A0AAT9V7I4_9CAUD|nr:hypothetical protein QB910_000040 [Alicyclobacillus phage KKP 3916]
MALQNQNFEMWAKDTVVLQVTVTDDNNLPIDLSNMQITWVLFKGTSSYANKTIGNGIAVTDVNNGVFQVTIQPSDTVNLTGLFNHECYIMDQYNNQSTVLTGIATIHPSSPFK